VKAIEPNYYYYDCCLLQGDEKRTGSTEHVTAGELPHACEELSETTAEDGHSDYEVGCGDAPSSNVVEGEDECGRRKREQTPGSFFFLAHRQFLFFFRGKKKKTHNDAGLLILLAGR
jgi:hypothetical protein